MKYSEIINYYEEFPFVAHIVVDAKRFREVERLMQDQTHARVIGHDWGNDDQICIHIGCRSAKLQEVVERWWA